MHTFAGGVLGGAMLYAFPPGARAKYVIALEELRLSLLSLEVRRSITSFSGGQTMIGMMSLPTLRSGVTCFMLCFLSGCDTPGDRADQIAPEHEKTIVKTADVIGPYSPGVKVGRLLFVSGQIALDPETGEMRDESIEAEARQVIANLSGVLDAAGYDASHVVRATVYLTDIGNYQRVNAVYADFFPEGGYPARVAVEVAKLPKNANVEISAIAYK